MHRTIMILLSCIILPDNVAFADDAAVVQAKPVALSCGTPSSVMSSTSCPWKRFTDQLSGATVDFPANLFFQTSVPPQASNEALVSGKGEMIAAVWSTRRNTSLSIREAMAADIYRSGFASVTGRNAYKSGYIISGNIGSRSLLKRRIFSGPRNRTVTTFCVTWPSDAAEQWPELATLMSRTLKPGKASAIKKSLSAPRRKDKITTCQGL